MSAKVLVNGCIQRPAFDYAGSYSDGTTPRDLITCQMLESMRNLLEDIVPAVVETNRLLGKIDKRLSQVEGMKLR